MNKTFLIEYNTTDSLILLITTFLIVQVILYKSSFNELIVLVNLIYLFI